MPLWPGTLPTILRDIADNAVIAVLDGERSEHESGPVPYTNDAGPVISDS
ncbi:hypothetical protein SAMN02745589_0335 [Bifidobacterium merycicum DSM 6492]|nr:hypothetical protein SAMN02745589_0335 [Bifidobacterium merycicum DSM 6492]